MNKTLLLTKLPRLLFPTRPSPTLASTLRHFFSTSTQPPTTPTPTPITHHFPYGQGGQFTFDLTNRTYSLSFQTIWEDHAQLQYSGLTGQQSFFLTQKGKHVNMDDADLQANDKEYIKMHSKIPQDYTVRGRINGSIHHLKNNVSSKTRSNPFEIEILGYKNTYQWLSLQTQDLKITNKHGQININSLTTKNALIDCQTFTSKKVLYSGEVTIKASNKLQVRSIVAYQDAPTKIIDSGDVHIESSSGKIEIRNCKSLRIDRLLSCKDGINIECDKIHEHIVVESGSGTIKCLKENKEVLKERVKLGKMHKGRLDFDYHEEDANSEFSKVLIVV